MNGVVKVLQLLSMEKHNNYRERPSSLGVLQRCFPSSIAVALYCFQLAAMGVFGAYVAIQVFIGVQGSGAGYFGLFFFCFFAWPVVVVVRRVTRGGKVFPQRYIDQWPLLLRLFSIAGFASAISFVLSGMGVYSSLKLFSNTAPIAVSVIGIIVSQFAALGHELLIDISEG